MYIFETEEGILYWQMLSSDDTTFGYWGISICIVCMYTKILIV